MSLHRLPTSTFVGGELFGLSVQPGGCIQIYTLVSLQLPGVLRISACRKRGPHYAEGDFNWI